MSVRIPWERVLVRSGFKVISQGEKVSLPDETEQNLEYLQKILDRGNFGRMENRVLLPNERDIDEDLWLSTVDICHGGAEGGSPDELRIMDTYIAGLIRWLNQIGISTTCGCDGKRRSRSPWFEAKDDEEARLAVWILNSREQYFVKNRKGVTFRSVNRLGQPIERKQLLDLAEWLHDNKTELSELLKVMRRIRSPKIRHKGTSHSPCNYEKRPRSSGK